MEIIDALSALKRDPPPGSPVGETPGRRILIVGTTCAGKTTLARTLAGRWGLPHIEMDALHWDRGWVAAPPAVFRARVSAALANGAWVVDGNYSQVRDLVWGPADTLVWLDYPLPLILWRLARRTLRRIVIREALWNGNQESWRGAFFSSDSLFVWALRTHRRRRRDYVALPARPEYAHLRVVRLRSPAATRRWLASLPRP